MREKLIEMLCEAKKLCIKTSCALCPGGGKGADCVEHLSADYLIANGVVILPDESAHSRGGGKVGAELGRGTNLTESGGQDGSKKY